MVMGKRFIACIATTICIVALFAVTVAFTGQKADASTVKSKKVTAGSAWIVQETTRLSRLTVLNDAVIKAPEGYSLTMTVDGVGTRIEPGEYSGDIVLTVTEEIKVQYAILPEPHYFRTAVYIENGKYIPEKSVAAAMVGGKVTDTLAKDFRITSEEENFNGIIDAYGMKVFLENASWIVDETSYLNRLSISKDADITAPEGCGVRMMVNGIDTTIKPGEYEGNIVLTVTKKS